MFINKLNIHNFRCIENLSLDISKPINVFYGENGAGKTSILEAIYFLSAGKSFRKTNFKNLINFNSDQLTVFIKNQQNFIFAVQRERNGDWSGKINGNKIPKHSDIAKHLKVISIDPEVYRLIDFGPAARRSFIDWSVFHVKHDYLKLWKDVHRLIKQINKLYKLKQNSRELENFENQFVSKSIELNSLRKEIFNDLLPILMKLVKNVVPEIHNLSIEFKQGWSDDKNLSECIQLDQERSFRYGQMQSGPQKMDIVIKLNSVPANQSFSRGQKKIVSIAFYLAYFQLLTQIKDISPILCLDDLDAELDDDRMAFLSEFILKHGSQTFITSLQKNKLSNLFPEAEMFHVKQGKVLT